MGATGVAPLLSLPLSHQTLIQTLLFLSFQEAQHKQELAQEGLPGKIAQWVAWATGGFITVLAAFVGMLKVLGWF